MCGRQGGRGGSLIFVTLVPLVPPPLPLSFPVLVVCESLWTYCKVFCETLTEVHHRRLRHMQHICQ